MKLISFALALLAVIGFVVQPIAPAYAARVDGFVGDAQTKQDFGRQVFGEQRSVLAGQTLDEFILDAQISPKLRERLADHAARGEAAILSRAQMNDLARKHPLLYGKLMHAYRTASTPKLTADEKKLVDQLTAGNIAAFKAGTVESLGCGQTASAGSLVGLLPENCASSSNSAGAWVVVGLMLTVIIGIPLFCAIAGQIGVAPAFCRGVTGP